MTRKAASTYLVAFLAVLMTALAATSAASAAPTSVGVGFYRGTTTTGHPLAFRVYGHVSGGSVVPTVGPFVIEARFICRKPYGELRSRLATFLLPETRLLPGYTFTAEAPGEITSTNDKPRYRIVGRFDSKTSASGTIEISQNSSTVGHSVLTGRVTIVNEFCFTSPTTWRVSLAR